MLSIFFTNSLQHQIENWEFISEKCREKGYRCFQQYFHSHFVANCKQYINSFHPLTLIIKFIVMEDYFSHTIVNKKYFVRLHYSPETKVAKIDVFLNSLPRKVFTTELPDQLIKEDVLKFLLQVRKHRKILINLNLLTITLLLSEKHELKLKDDLKFEEEGKDQADNKKSNNDAKHWIGKREELEIDAVLDPCYEIISLWILSKIGQVKVAETTISKKSLLKKSSPLKGKHKEEQLLRILMKAITESTVFNIQWKQKTLRTNHELLRIIPIRTSIVIEKVEDEILSERVKLFKHIFLTEIITQMIIYQFGRSKQKVRKNRDGYELKQYFDEELEELRSLGYRFNEFRDHSIQKNKKNKVKNEKQNKKQIYSESDDSDDSDDSIELDNQDGDQDQSESSDNQQDKQIILQLQSNPKLKKKQSIKKKKWKVIREKMRNFDHICNFTFISGKEKSKINKMRYCLHQMTRETDKTEALINFVQFAFKVYAKEDLVGNGNDKQKKKEGMAFFLDKFKAKREIKSCFQEYTRESFFHKILNIGLRALKNPQQLVYLRLPFSHMFWSIKTIYQRHKRAIFGNKSEKNKNRTILLYRGFEMKEKQLKGVKKNIGSFIETEGFISTSLSESFSGAFAVNANMVIEIPVANLRGMYDNGFAQIRTFSLHPNEKQVLFNAFNIFKILSLQSAFNEEKELLIYTIHLEYGGIKQIESKVQKSQNLLDAEYVWKENQKELEKAQQKLEMNRPNLTKKQYEKLKALFPKAKQQLDKREKELLEWKQQQYKQALAKLSQWEKELIVNAKHQLSYMQQFQNYGNLLIATDHWLEATAYYERKIKLVELNKILQGHYWRKNFFYLKNNEHALRKKLFYFYIHQCKLETALNTGKKWLNILISENDPQYFQEKYELIFYLWKISIKMYNQRSQKQYLEQFLAIAKKHKLQHTPHYQVILAETDANKKGSQDDEQQEKQKQMKKNKNKEIKEMKDELKEIKFSTYGKYSIIYLSQLHILVRLLFRWQEWVDVIKYGQKYLRIRKKNQLIENRIETHRVFTRLRKAYKLLGWGYQFDFLYETLAEFLDNIICSHSQFRLVAEFICECRKLRRWRNGRMVLSKLIHTKVQCKLSQLFVQALVWCGYVTLLMSVSKQKLVDQFLQWAQDLYTSQHYTKTSHYYIFQSILKWNEQYNKQENSPFVEREKDFKDSGCIKFVDDILQGKKAIWVKKSAQLFHERIPTIIWQRPFSYLSSNIDHLANNLALNTIKGEPNLIFNCQHQFKSLHSSMFDSKMTHTYLRRINTLSKLHLNDSDLRDLPSLLEFWPYQISQLETMFFWELGLNLEKTVAQNQRREQKEKYLAKIIKKRKTLLFSRKKAYKFNPQDKTSLSIQRVRNIYSRYSHYLLFTSNRRLKILCKNTGAQFQKEPNTTKQEQKR